VLCCFVLHKKIFGILFSIRNLIAPPCFAVEKIHRAVCGVPHGAVMRIPAAMAE